jgi:hypothetical protein
MPAVKRDVLEVLRYELNFLEQGGYDRVKQLGLPVSIFQDSLTCLNHGNPLRPHACHECPLYDFVSAEGRAEDIPCHHIPLDPQGRTIEDIAEPRARLEKVKKWLQDTIADLQSDHGVSA